jgi:hypothetical protein
MHRMTAASLQIVPERRQDLMYFLAGGYSGRLALPGS